MVRVRLAGHSLALGPHPRKVAALNW
jgi:hypothetical protein